MLSIRRIIVLDLSFTMIHCMRLKIRFVGSVAWIMKIMQRNTTSNLCIITSYYKSVFIQKMKNHELQGLSLQDFYQISNPSTLNPHLLVKEILILSL